jgi:hypothetical protein
MILYGFLYECVVEDEYQEAGCASASTEVWATKEQARAAMLASANAEITDWNEQEGEGGGDGIEALMHCEDHIWVEELGSYWTLFETELKS